MPPALAIGVVYNSFPVFARWALKRTPAQAEPIEPKKDKIEREEIPDSERAKEEHHASIRGR